MNDEVQDSRVRVNQHGYCADGPQRATVVSESADALAWQVRDGDGAVVASGVTSPRGVEETSGLAVHVVDFGPLREPGPYTLVIAGCRPHPIEVRDGLYEPLLIDALNYFYLARSGIEISADIVGAEYARAAGHVSVAGGADVNQGDLGVACQPADETEALYGTRWSADYRLDVAGGWYDAGDHGKYVVNGGIAVAQLLGVWERALRAGDAAVAALGDGALRLPEHGDGVPDVLNEARWELDFMMAMVVPEGDALAGMVHHKVHDHGWTGLPMLPIDDPRPRYLHRPSTAATLNLAATAAQGARLWRPYDEPYAHRLLAAGRAAWLAALAHPDLYAPVADGANGGGPYDDDDVSDEFYWAAVELFLTTGEGAFEEFVQTSPVHEADSFPVGGFRWDAMGAIAKIDLATVANDFPNRALVAEQVVAGARRIAAVQQEQPWGVALPPDGFIWGSNSQLLDNIQVLGAGYDLSGDESLLAAAQESLDYLLGRNALGLSYVTGYGSRWVRNQHSRWFAHQADPALPHPPRGSVAGGPNALTDTWDPIIRDLYPDGECAPQAAYVDHIESWSTNEITVNWNSALAAASAFLAFPHAPVAVS
ncbi:glycoside hydrolase family 9 protein [Demequina sp. NBRC 110053]|uniref:glycoside hydrolase family 9 protein n=1 Tax=Demequina sp. NBRC 110053 TaxID=1570342 RepID=UPI001F1F8CA8|nr:glycoside hydrolase family 9 protein [Demequina sp. NBRC 110053]